MELREPEELRAEPLRVQQQLLDDETRALQVIKINLFMNLCRSYSVVCLIEDF